MDCDKAILSQLGLDFEILDSGCCGMAGSFGFETDKYPVSMAIGEQVLLPAVRAAANDTLIVADGFSCREQIRQGTDRAALHPAQVLQLALRGEQVAQYGAYPEAQYADLGGAADSKGSTDSAAAAALP
jgi:Fe-S oxidoreductase